MTDLPPVPPVGLIGFGRWGALLANELPKAGLELAAIAVKTEAHARVLASAMPGIAVTTDCATLINNQALAAIVVAAPAQSHEVLVRAALLEGHDVFVEKPLSLSGPAARELTELAHEQKAILFVGHIFVHHPAIVALETLIARGELGELQAISACWTNIEATPGDVSVIWNLGPHPLSIIALLCGSGAESLMAVRNGEEVAITIDHGDGLTSRTQLNWAADARQRRVKVIGSNATAVFDDESKRLMIHGHDGIEQPVEFDRAAPLGVELRAFCEALSKRTARGDGDFAVNVVTWLEAAETSQQTAGHSISLA